jgi:hypothetical protein
MKNQKNQKNQKNTKKIDYFKKVQRRHKHLTIRRIQINGEKLSHSRK